MLRPGKLSAIRQWVASCGRVAPQAPREILAVQDRRHVRLVPRSRQCSCPGIERSATPPLERGACEEHVLMLTSPLCPSTGAVSWKQPEFGLSNDLSSSRPSNPDVKQAHGEAEPVHRGDGRQLTGRGKLYLFGTSGTRQRCPFTGPPEGVE